MEITGTNYIPTIPNKDNVEKDIEQINKLEEFNSLLSQFYTTNDDSRIKQFIYDNCIDGISFQN